MAILDTVKKSLLIPISETYADTELTGYINSCRELLTSMGVKKEEVDEGKNALVDSLIIIYCKTFFGYKTDGSVKELPKSFDMLTKQLVLTKGDNLNVS
jgi:formyltetrahydrofolate synthetase